MLLSLPRRGDRKSLKFEAGDFDFCFLDRDNLDYLSGSPGFLAPLVSLWGCLALCLLCLVRCGLSMQYLFPTRSNSSSFSSDWGPLDACPATAELNGFTCRLIYSSLVCSTRATDCEGIERSEGLLLPESRPFKGLSLFRTLRV